MRVRLGFRSAGNEWGVVGRLGVGLCVGREGSLFEGGLVIFISLRSRWGRLCWAWDFDGIDGFEG